MRVLAETDILSPHSNPGIEGWSVAGDSYADVRALVDAGVEIALDRPGVAIEHFVPADIALTG